MLDLLVSLFCNSHAIIIFHCTLSALVKNRTFVTCKLNYIFTIIRDHAAEWSLMRNRKQENKSNSRPKTGLGRLRNLSSRRLRFF